MVYLLLLVFFMTADTVFSDEGMWTLDNLPLKRLEKEYGKSPKPALLKKIQLASVRFNDGGSGSFVSKNGLLLTNHHVALGQLQKLSGKKNDYVKDGFYAKKEKDELKCPDLEVNILMSYENVTEKVLNFVREGDAKGASDRRKKITSQIELESFQKTGLRSNVIELYNGGEYWLYRYKKLTDVRLVYAPETALAAFGGNTDNFQYPRYDFDFAFFRAYENGKPFKSPQFFQWNSEGAKPGELIFVSGHPGSTDRGKTMAEIKFMKDVEFPEHIKNIKKGISHLREYSARDKESERRARAGILGMENSRQAMEGEYAGISDPRVYSLLLKKEEEFQKLLSRHPEKAKVYREAYSKIEAAVEKKKGRIQEIMNSRLSGTLFHYGLSLVRYLIEKEKPNEKRYEEYRDSSLDSFRHRIFSNAPIYKDKEKFMLKKSMERLKEELGENHRFVVQIFQDYDRIEKTVDSTKLDDPEFRKKVFEMKIDDLENTKDEFLLWIRKLEPYYRELREWHEKEIEEVFLNETEKIQRLKFELSGKDTYPDATFSLRLSYGKIQGMSVDGFQIPPFTTMYGLMERHENFSKNPEFVLPEKFLSLIEKLDLKKKLNFISTHDIIGGNSGSPVVNLKGELVGLIFDGNAYSHILNYTYDGEKSRSVSVHPAGMMELLKKYSRADRLVKEIENHDD